ncbi:MAG: aminoacyl-tRNA hydrolase [Candidatus Magasanikbacteria bacterium]|nr:aminoacyl-tRNA hydrolase [Candidatus Magasanikbacteria bacterium]
MHIITGLGNPGTKYEITRHNIGFIFLDSLIQEKGLVWETSKKFNAEICKDGDTIYVKPQTFMNESGRSVQAIMSFYNLVPKKLGVLKIKNSNLSDTLTVIHDDLDIDLGKFKISDNSRSAGHNGVQSIINHLKTQNFTRIRIGIRGNKPEQMPVANYVLQKFSDEELKITKELFSEIKKEL